MTANASNFLFQIKMGKLNPKWTSSIMIGVIDCSLEKVTFPSSALAFKKACWMICGDCVFQSGTKVKTEINFCGRLTIFYANYLMRIHR